MGELSSDAIIETAPIADKIVIITTGSGWGRAEVATVPVVNVPSELAGLMSEQEFPVVTGRPTIVLSECFARSVGEAPRPRPSYTVAEVQQWTQKLLNMQAAERIADREREEIEKLALERRQEAEAVALEKMRRLHEAEEAKAESERCRNPVYLIKKFEARLAKLEQEFRNRS